MRLKVKGISLIISIALSLTMIPSIAFAETTGQDEFDLANSTQAITQPSPEDLKLSSQKEKDAKKLVDAISSYKNSKLTKTQLKDSLKEFNDKYIKSSSTMNADSIIVSATSTSKVLNWAVAKQETDWYCGPASAFNILRGMGISSNNGRSLSQYNLATDLGARDRGASWPGSWASTMNTWQYWNSYVTSNGPTATQLLSYAYIDANNSLGCVYDTHMSGSNQLYGYAINSERYHYLGGDGYDNSSSQVHYMDSNNLNSTAFGSHWTSASLMAKCTAERGMVW